MYKFMRSVTEFFNGFFTDKFTELDLYEMGKQTPCMLMTCAEEHSIITKVHSKDRYKMVHVVTITEDDNLLSPFRKAKWKRCIRSSLDCVFFAGPCTGGSPWNRLNKRLSATTALMIRAKEMIYWEVWGGFAGGLQRVINMDAMAIMELPRLCAYCKDPRNTDMINGTDAHVHDFDGCMYGLKTNHINEGTAIKKPWRIVTWGVNSGICI